MPVIDWVASGCLYGRFRFGIAAKLRFLRQPDEIREFSTIYSCIVEIDKVAPGTYQGIITMKKIILSAALAVSGLTFGGIYAAASDAASSQEKVSAERCHTHAEG